MDEFSGDTWMNKQNEKLLRSQFPLHSAIRDGDMETTLSLLKNGQCDLYEEDGFYGWTPVHWAAHFGKLDCLTELLQHGASCDVATHRFNQTPAHIAALSASLHCLKWLLHWGASLNRQDFLGETPLHKAARCGSMECVSLLTSQGCALGLRNHSGHTPSQVASLGGFEECAIQLEKSLQFQEQAMAANIVSTYNCNNNNIQASANGKDTHQNGDLQHLGNDVDMGCEMDTVPEESMHKSHVNGLPVANGFHIPQQNGFGGIKRGRDDFEEEFFKRRRFEDTHHAEARVISPCSMDQDHSSHPTTPMTASGVTSCHVISPNPDIPVKCLTLHSHMI